MDALSCCGRLADPCCEDPGSRLAAADRLERDGREIARRATRAGLQVTLADGSTRPIPIGALPVVVDDDAMLQRTRLAALLTGAVNKMAQWRMKGARREATLSALRPAERRLVEATWDQADDLAVARVDFLGGDALSALEVNATIPAMQGYSDMAADAWLSVQGEGLPELAGLIAANGSNSLALLASLLELYDRRGRGRPDTIGLLCRRGDAQLTELTYLRDRFQAAGFDARIVHPDELAWSGNALHAGAPLDLVYRHLFLSRLEDTASDALERAMSSGSMSRTLVLNRPAPHLEMKSTLALLSQAADDDAFSRSVGLAPDERDAIRVHVPWTRWLRAGLPGQDVDEIRARVRTNPRDFVLKRSWSHGGQDVFLGAELADDLDALKSAFPGVGSWPELVDQAARDDRGGGFVAQRAVHVARSPQILCTENTATRADVFTDFAAYASIGASPAWSGVCRASTNAVVNIVRGGAVVPVIRRSVYERVRSRLRAPVFG